MKNQPCHCPEDGRGWSAAARAEWSCVSPVWIQCEFCICLVEDALVYLPRDPFFTFWVHT